MMELWESMGPLDVKTTILKMLQVAQDVHEETDVQSTDFMFHVVDVHTEDGSFSTNWYLSQNDEAARPAEFSLEIEQSIIGG